MAMRLKADWESATPLYEKAATAFSVRHCPKHRQHTLADPGNAKSKAAAYTLPLATAGQDWSFCSCCTLCPACSKACLHGCCSCKRISHGPGRQQRRLQQGMSARGPPGRQPSSWSGQVSATPKAVLVVTHATGHCEGSSARGERASSPAG